MALGIYVGDSAPVCVYVCHLCVLRCAMRAHTYTHSKNHTAAPKSFDKPFLPHVRFAAHISRL